MRLAAVTRVRNECDIIEAFVRHNASFLDRLYIVDNQSTDTTPIILQKLRQEGFPLILSEDRDLSFHQAAKTTEQIRQALKDDHHWDIVFPLDGDEFLRVPDRSSLETQLETLFEGGIHTGYLHLDHYSPTPVDDSRNLDAIRRITHRAHVDFPPIGGKVVVPGSAVRDRAFRLSEGNHGIAVDGAPMPRRLLDPVRLAHFPIRSSEQFKARVAVGYLAWISRSDYDLGWIGHLRQFYEKLEENSQLTAADLAQAAFRYAVDYIDPSFPDTVGKLLKDPLPPAYNALRYADLIRVDSLARILGMAARIAEELRLAKRGNKLP